MAEIVAGQITGTRTLEYRTYEEGSPGPGLLTIAISLCGICGTDVFSYRTGHLHQPSVCGHEWVGTVAEIGAGVDGFTVGDRVIIAVPPSCGTCAECRRGATEHCRTVSMVARGRDALAPRHGGFASHITVAPIRVMHVRGELSDEDAAQVEPASVAFHGVRRSGILPGDVVAVQGVGPIGMFAAQFARAAGAGQVIVIEPSAFRRRVSVEVGVSDAVEPADALDAVHTATEGLGADVVLECTGVPQLLQTAADLTRSGGTVGLLSFLAQPATIAGASWLAKQLQLVASNAFTNEDLRRCMAMLADGRVLAAPLHSRTIGLDQLAVTLDELAGGGTDDIKVLVDPRRVAAR